MLHAAHVPVANVACAASLPAFPVQAELSLISIGVERPGDAGAREWLLDRAFGPARFRKSCERLRAGRLPARGLSLAARASSRLGDGEVVGTVRLWHVEAGGTPALMLGPLAVDARFRCEGVGGRLMEAAIVRALALGHRAIILVGDAPYYERFGFARRLTSGLRMPGRIDDERLLGLELVPGALADAAGDIAATGAIAIPNRAESYAMLRRAG